MTNTLPKLTEFHVEIGANGIVHLVFDCQGRSMNVFSNKAIHELGEFSNWLHDADVKGVLVRSGKATGFCAGADLTELGVAYEMIVAAKPADRFDIAFNHFFPLGHAIRRLETAGKPVAAAIAGVALGGGCELALGCHYRVLGNTPRALLGLPECQVGLLPGAGGTQRMPRLVGVEAGLGVLLQAKTYSGQSALGAGLVDELVEQGEEVAAAEAWLLSGKAHHLQPWDEDGHQPANHAEYSATIDAHRSRELDRMLGHEPAPIAILDCVEIGMMQPMDGAIRSEMSVFSKLIQRQEPRNMIRSMFLGKQAWDKAVRKESVSPAVIDSGKEIGALVARAVSENPALSKAQFGEIVDGLEPVQRRVGAEPWLLSQVDLLNALSDAGKHARELVGRLGADELLQLDYFVTSEQGVPAYIGGVSGLVVITAG